MFNLCNGEKQQKPLSVSGFWPTVSLFSVSVFGQDFNFGASLED